MTQVQSSPASHQGPGVSELLRAAPTSPKSTGTHPQRSHSPAPGSSVLPHLPLPQDTVAGMGPREAGDQGRITSGVVSNSKPRDKMTSNNSKNMTSNVRKRPRPRSSGPLATELGQRPAQTCGLRGAWQTRGAVSGPIDGYTVSQQRRQGWGFRAPMRWGDRPRVPLSPSPPGP